MRWILPGGEQPWTQRRLLKWVYNMNQSITIMRLQAISTLSDVYAALLALNLLVG
jgi:hypothetical protein